MVKNVIVNLRLEITLLFPTLQGTSGIFPILRCFEKGKTKIYLRSGLEDMFSFKTENRSD